MTKAVVPSCSEVIPKETLPLSRLQKSGEHVYVTAELLEYSKESSQTVSWTILAVVPSLGLPATTAAGAAGLVSS